MESLFAELTATPGAAARAGHDAGAEADAGAAGDDASAVRGRDAAPGDDARAEADAAARCWPAMAGTIHLTMPLSALAGGTEPGEVAGHGPVDAAASRQIAALLGQNTTTRWCVTATGPDG